MHGAICLWDRDEFNDALYYIAQRRAALPPELTDLMIHGVPG